VRNHSVQIHNCSRLDTMRSRVTLPRSKRERYCHGLFSLAAVVSHPSEVEIDNGRRVSVTYQDSRVVPYLKHIPTLTAWSALEVIQDESPK